MLWRGAQRTEWSCQTMLNSYKVVLAFKSRKVSAADVHCSTKLFFHSHSHVHGHKSTMHGWRQVLDCYVTTRAYRDFWVFSAPNFTMGIKNTHNILPFYHAFSSVVRQMPGYNSQRQGTARALLKLIVLFCVLFVCKCVLYYCHRV